jgi:predicted amidohydrolase YtcJ
MAADLMLRNMAGQRLDGQLEPVELIAIQGNRITYAGAADALGELCDADTRVIDCQGGMVLPGFNDAHCHPFAFAMSQIYLDCSQARCIGDILAVVRGQAGRARKQKWLRAAQVDVSSVAENRLPYRWELDKAVADRPILLVERSGQHCALNTLALALCGIDENTADAENESIGRDPVSRKPNGLVSGNSERIARAIPPPTDEEIQAGLRQANLVYLSLGITSLQDTSWSNTYHHWQAWHNFKQRGLLAPRLTMLAGYDALEELKEKGLRTGHGDLQIRLGAMKIALDESSGVLYPSQEDLNQAALRTHLAGFQLSFHVPDVELLQTSLRALAFVSGMALTPCARPRFEHCPVCPPSLMPMLAESEAIIVSQPNLFQQTGPAYLDQVAGEQLNWIYPYRSFLDHGIPLAFSSDAPLTPCDPLQAILTALTRTVSGGQKLVKEQQLSLFEAIDAYTSAGAYATGEELEKGKLAQGQLADLTVLHTHGETLPEQFATAEVVMTLIDGNIAWEK